MDVNARKMAESWTDQAGTHSSTARERVKSSFTYAEAVQAAQLCVELSVKAILSFLQMDFPKAHGLKQEHLQSLAEQCRKRKLLEKLEEQNLHHWVNLPRMFFLMKFWGEFYLLAKYGMEAGNLATPKELFNKGEADLAISHAEECERAARRLGNLSVEDLKRLLS